MHPAKALATAVHTLSDVTYANSVNIRHTDIVVILKFGRYFIYDAGTQYNVWSRDEAIEKLVQLLSNKEELTPAEDRKSVV